MQFSKKVVLILLCSLAFFSCQSKIDINIETYRVARGEFLASVTETGELKAVNSEMISAPSIDWRFGALKITRLVEDGDQVAAGDVIVEFDKAEVEKAIVDAKAEFGNRESRASQNIGATSVPD